jgi:D-alanyl-D-alanine dipeptidase
LWQALCALLVVCASCAVSNARLNKSDAQFSQAGGAPQTVQNVRVQQQTLPGDLVELQAVNPRIRVFLPYATANNFAKQQLYPTGMRCFVRRSAAEKLDSIQRFLEPMGLGLKVFDGYRPLSVQKKMWALVPDENYVANPAKGSRHNRGAAVDVTLVRLNDGEELLMPTPFDDFTDKASHRAVEGIPAEALRNRFLLRSVMEKFGFRALLSEWWHYDEIGWERYDILDIDSVLVR